jgi:hypothetical protein
MVLVYHVSVFVVAAAPLRRVVSFQFRVLPGQDRGLFIDSHSPLLCLSVYPPGFLHPPYPSLPYVSTIYAVIAY